MTKIREMMGMRRKLVSCASNFICQTGCKVTRMLIITDYVLAV